MAGWAIILINTTLYEGYMSKYFDYFGIKDEYGELISIKDDCHYGDPRDSVMSVLFDFCGCGLPEDTQEYVRIMLESINMSDWKESQKYMEEQLGKQDDGSTFFFWYWAETADLTTHGGSVPGWLTEKGKMLLGLLNEIKEKYPK
jgi:hypothetical protein